MKSTRKLLAILVIAVFALTLLAGCGPPAPPSPPAPPAATPAQTGTTPTTPGETPTQEVVGTPDEPIVVTFMNWGTIEEASQDHLLAVIAAFEAENPGIIIDNQPVGVSDIVREVTIRSIAGNPPDVAQLHGDNVGQMHAAGFLQPVGPLLSQEFMDDLFPVLFDVIGLIDGQHYAVPWANSTHGLFYNRILMEQAGLDPNRPPRNIEEMTQMMIQARERLPADVHILQADTSVRTIGLSQQWPIMLAFMNGVQPYTLCGQANMTHPGMIEYLEWMRMLVNEGITTEGLFMGMFRPFAAQNNLLFANDWTTFDGIVRSMNDELTREIMFETWGATHLPAGSDGIARTNVNAHVLTIFRDSQVSEAAGRFVEFLVNSEVAVQQYIAQMGFTPVTASAFDKAPELNDNEFIRAFVSDVMPTSVPMPTGPDFGEFATIVMTAVQEAVTTDRDIIAIAEDAQRRLEMLFN